MKTALVIDDSKTTVDAMCKMLSLLGLEATPAYGPRAAMLVLNDMVPDIVFLDINMPGVTGYEVIAYLRRSPQHENVPVVFVTSDDQPETISKARKTGALLVIIKPVTVEALENTLRKVGLI